MIAPQPTAPVRPATEPAPAPAPNRDPVPPSLVACPDCDLLNRLDGPAAATLLCARCGAVLRRHRPDSIDRTLALVVAALLCFLQVYGIARMHDPWGWLLWLGG